MYDFKTFYDEREGKIAKNLLLNKVCNNCYFLRGKTMKCEKRVDSFSYELTKLPEVRTCTNWKNRYYG